MNAYITFGEILSIFSQDIDWADIVSKNNSAMGYHDSSIALLQPHEVCTKCAQVSYLILFHGRIQRDEQEVRILIPLENHNWL